MEQLASVAIGAAALRLNKQDVMAAARQRGLERLEQVRYAVAERDGKIAIVEEDS